MGLTGLDDIVGGYQSAKAQSAAKERAWIEGRSEHAEYRTGKTIGHYFAGSVPVLGSLTSLLAAKKRYDEEDKLKKLKNKGK